MRLTVLISCPDQPGIVARFSMILFRAHANILTLEEHTENGWFFMRIDAELSTDAAAAWPKLQASLRRQAAELTASIKIYDQSKQARVALLVTNETACPQELLSRQKAGELNCKIPIMIGNQPALEELADMYGIEFKYVSYDQGILQAEQQIITYLRQARIDLIILARFMKVLSPEFVNQFPEQIINIHHGFLPAFKGSRPYHQAWNHGVKVIGATAHFVTANLDEGPIISQEVMPVTHQFSPKDMIKAGQDVERRVLLHATTACLDHKIILHKQRTVVFR